MPDIAAQLSAAQQWALDLAPSLAADARAALEKLYAGDTSLLTDEEREAVSQGGGMAESCTRAALACLGGEPERARTALDILHADLSRRRDRLEGAALENAGALSGSVEAHLNEVSRWRTGLGSDAGLVSSFPWVAQRLRRAQAAQCSRHMVRAALADDMSAFAAAGERWDTFLMQFPPARLRHLPSSADLGARLRASVAHAQVWDDTALLHPDRPAAALLADVRGRLPLADSPPLLLPQTPAATLGEVVARWRAMVALLPAGMDPHVLVTGAQPEVIGELRRTWDVALGIANEAGQEMYMEQRLATQWAGRTLVLVCAQRGARDDLRRHCEKAGVRLGIHRSLRMPTQLTFMTPLTDASVTSLQVPAAQLWGHATCDHPSRQWALSQSIGHPAWMHDHCPDCGHSFRGVLAHAVDPHHPLASSVRWDDHLAACRAVAIMAGDPPPETLQQLRDQVSLAPAAPSAEEDRCDLASVLFGD